jgi:hypothetical protein
MPDHDKPGCDTAAPEALRAAGESFQAGCISVPQVSALLGLHPVDAVAVLESHGYARSLATLALTEQERAAIYARMRADRLARRGAPVITAESIARDTIASARIEGVDVRRWIARDGWSAHGTKNDSRRGSRSA